MENTTLIMLIVSLIILMGVSFLIFQTWLSIKEIKLTFPKLFEDLRSSDTLIKETILDTKATHTESIKEAVITLNSKMNECFENVKRIIDSVENKIINEQSDLRKEVRNSFSDVIKTMQNLEDNLLESIYKLKDNFQEIKDTFPKELAPLIIQINSNNEKVIEEIKSIEKNLNNEVEKLHKAITEPLDF